MKFQGKHVLITGGSAGIGLALAKDALRRGATVTLVARNKAKLQEAKQALIETGTVSETSVFVASADVTDVQQVLDAIAAATAALGPVDVVICNAGVAVPGYFHQQDLSVHRSQMELNYFGVLNTVKAVYDDMIKRRAGHICIVGSGMSTMGFVGYSSYAPSKHAVKGLAECLRNEVKGSGVTVSLAMPPDTSTPGFAAENTSKPAETAKISEGGGVFTPEQVAKLMLDGIQKGRFFLPCPDLGLGLHYRLVQGLVPRRLLTLVLDMLAGFIGPLIQHFIAQHHDAVATKGASTRFADLG